MPRRPHQRVAIALSAFLLLSFHAAARTAEKALRIEPVASPADVITPGGTAWALLVGVGQYPEIEGGSIGSLRAPTKDVDALYGFLSDPKKGGFKPENVRMLKDSEATKDAIGIELKDIANKAAENDLVLIYFSGHGFRPEGDDAGGAPAYLIPYLTHPRALIDPAGTCIDYSDLAQKVRAMRAEKVVTILDACHAGGVKPAGSKGVQLDVYSRFYEAWDRAQGRPLLLSSDASEVSWEESDGSVFTKFLLRGLEGAADENQDAIVSFNEVATYLEREVPRYTRSEFSSAQTPTRRYEHGPVRGDIPLALDLGQYETIQQRGVHDARMQAILLAELGVELEELSLQLVEKVLAQQPLGRHESALLAQLDRFVLGTISRDDYATRAQALIRPTRPRAMPAALPADTRQQPSTRPDATMLKPSADVPQLTIHEIATLRGHAGRVWSVAFSLDGEMLASGGHDDTVKLWDVRSNQEIATLEGHPDWIESVAFSPDGAMLASGSDDNTVKLWDIRTGQEIATLQGHMSWVLSVAFSHDGDMLASGSGDSTVKLWNVAKREEIATLQGHADEVGSIAFSRDGETLASGSDDGTVRLWNVPARQETATLRGHESGVTSVAFTHDGTALASGGDDNTVKLWDVAAEQEIRTLNGHAGPVNAIAFALDGATLASGSDDRTVVLWDVATGKTIVTLGGHSGPVHTVAFSPDGVTLASGGEDHTVKLRSVVR